MVVGGRELGRRGDGKKEKQARKKESREIGDGEQLLGYVRDLEWRETLGNLWG